MLHGWMDVSASFQFLVDCLQADWHVIAPDWRGFGLTRHAQSDTYWFPDYLADLDAILQHYSPQEPAILVGHSMGGNIAMVYAGVRPEQVAKLVNLEGFGLPPASPQQAPARMAKWLAEVKNPPSFRQYADLNQVAVRLQGNNPRLNEEQALFLAQQWAASNSAGEWELRADPAHKMVNPILYRIDEVLACWQSIAAPVLWLEAQDGHLRQWPGPADEARAEIDRRIAAIPNVTTALVLDAGHMLHVDQPRSVASMTEQFLSLA